VQLLRSDFGLQAFIAQQTVPAHIDKVVNDASWRSQSPRLTLAYLTLPCNKSIRDLGQNDSRDDYDYEYGFINATNICNIIDPSSLTISNDQRQRFHRAMKFLGISPSLHAIQVLNEDDKDGPILTGKQKTEVVQNEAVLAIKKRLSDKVKGACRSLLTRLNSIALLAEHCQ
jgi:hypothetical protein